MSSPADAVASAPDRPWLLRRWPAAAGLVLALATGIGIAGGGEVVPVVTASGFVYLGAAALRSRAAAWPVFAVAFVLIGIGRAVPAFDPSWWMLGLAAVLVGYGASRGALRPPWGLPLQAAAMLVLGAVALVAVEAAAGWAGLVVAAGLLAHAAWDVHHHRTERVVARSMAEFCAVLDTVLALVVLIVTVT
ncbi:hypothetical protein [Pseudonocardia nigra]|uniref:hypothetical protein n=1 Tax=Pseudonocardia nigra TaxID=1921578 RepID=UPI001C5CDF39|nr:hypothetical protein [Pseudonocardia nigra]